MILAAAASKIITRHAPYCCFSHLRPEMCLTSMMDCQRQCCGRQIVACKARSARMALAGTASSSTRWCKPLTVLMMVHVLPNAADEAGWLGQQALVPTLVFVPCLGALVLEVLSCHSPLPAGTYASGVQHNENESWHIFGNICSGRSYLAGWMVLYRASSMWCCSNAGLS